MLHTNADIDIDESKDRYKGKDLEFLLFKNILFGIVNSKVILMFVAVVVIGGQIGRQVSGCTDNKIAADIMVRRIRIPLSNTLSLKTTQASICCISTSDHLKVCNS